MRESGLLFGRLPEYLALSSARSLSELCKLFDVDLPEHSVDIISTKRKLTEMRLKSEELLAAGDSKKNRMNMNSQDVSKSGSDIPDESGGGNVETESGESGEKEKCGATLQLPATDLR